MSIPCPPGVDHEIRRLLRRGTALGGGTASADHHLLWNALGEATEGGRRFRPALLLATHDSLGGSRHEAAIQVAAAVERIAGIGYAARPRRDHPGALSG